MIEKFKKRWKNIGGKEKNRKIFLSLGFFLLLIPSLFLVEKGLEKVFLNEIEERTYLERAALRNRFLASMYEAKKPIRVPRFPDPDLKAKAGMVVYLEKDSRKVLFEKEVDKPLHIASISKIMSCLVALENYDLDTEVIVSPLAENKIGGPNYFKAGERFSVRSLIYSSLIESSNRAVCALSEMMGEKVFVGKMNEKAEALGMEKTRFYNPSGLDSNSTTTPSNVSTASDLVLLAQEILETPVLKRAAQERAMPIYSYNGEFHHNALNTNKLLAENEDFILSKTGQTNLAGECLLVAYPARKEEGVVVAVVLGTEDKFEEMQKLIDWTRSAHRW